MGPIAIESERLLAREWTIDDIEDVVTLASDEEVTQFLGPLGGTVREDAEDFLGRQIKMQSGWGWCRWALQLRVPEPGLAGVVGFCGPGCTFAPDVEVGWTLRRELWGRGLATEIGRVVVDYCFSVIGFERLICCVDPDNTASLRVAAKAGFTKFDEIEHHGTTVIRHEILNPLPMPPRDPRFRLSCEGAPTARTVEPQSTSR